MSLSHIFIEMEKLNGGTLEDFIDKKLNESMATQEITGESTPEQVNG